MESPSALLSMSLKKLKTKSIPKKSVLKKMFLGSRLKKFLYSRRDLAKPENPKFHTFCLLRENFQT